MFACACVHVQYVYTCMYDWGKRNNHTHGHTHTCTHTGALAGWHVRRHTRMHTHMHTHTHVYISHTYRHFISYPIAWRNTYFCVANSPFHGEVLTHASCQSYKCLLSAARTSVSPYSSLKSVATSVMGKCLLQHGRSLRLIEFIIFLASCNSCFAATRPRRANLIPRLAQKLHILSNHRSSLDVWLQSPPFIVRRARL